MARRYTDEAAVEKYMVLTIDPSYSSQITAWIEGMTRVIEKITGRTFQTEEDEEASIRYFDGNGKVTMSIDEALSITSVELGDALGDNFTAITDDIKKAPRIAPHRNILYTSGFTCGVQNVKVTAIWGHTAEVPEDIKFVCTVMVAGIINASQNKMGKKSEKIGNYQVTYGDDQARDFERAIAILDSYKLYYF